MLGSTTFGVLMDRNVSVKRSMAVMLAAAATSLGCAAALGNVPATLVASFLVFEACVGVYFPSMGTLRSQYLPDEHRGVIMNLFQIPLNAIVIAVYTNQKRLGATGALWCSAGSLFMAFLAQLRLNSIEAKNQAPVSF